MRSDRTRIFGTTAPPGGGATGTLLGDPGNPVICRHVHCVAYNPAEKPSMPARATTDEERGTSAIG